jgi:predicted RNA methylase
MPKSWEDIKNERAKKQTYKQEGTTWEDIKRKRAGIQTPAQNAPAQNGDYTSIFKNYKPHPPVDFTPKPIQTAPVPTPEPTPLQRAVADAYINRGQPQIAAIVPTFSNTPPKELPDMLRGEEAPAQKVVDFVNSVGNSILQGAKSASKGIVNAPRAVDKAFSRFVFVPGSDKYDKGFLPFLDDYINYIAEGEKQSEQAANQNAGSVQKFINSGVKGVTEMAPNIVTAIGTGGASAGASLSAEATTIAKALSQLKPMGMFMTQAAGQYAYEAEQEGATPEQALTYGIYGGLSEGVTELLPFGILKKALNVGDDVAKPFVKNGVKGLLDRFGKKGLLWLEETGANVVQEIAVNPLTQLAKKGAYQNDMPIYGDGGVIDPNQVVPSAQGALAMSLVLTALGLPFSMRSNRLATKIVQSTEKPTEQVLKELQQAVQEDIKSVPIGEIQGSETPLNEPEALNETTLVSSAAQKPVEVTPSFNQGPTKTALSATTATYKEGDSVVYDGEIWTVAGQNEDGTYELNQKENGIFKSSAVFKAPAEKIQPNNIENPELNKYGRKGQNAFKSWAKNEYVNIDISNTESTETKLYKNFFETYYNGGLNGLPIPLLQKTASVLDAHFPPFLADVFYVAGKNDATKQREAPTPTKNTPVAKTETGAKNTVGEYDGIYGVEKRKQATGLWFANKQLRSDMFAKYSSEDTSLNPTQKYVANVGRILSGAFDVSPYLVQQPSIKRDNITNETNRDSKIDTKGITGIASSTKVIVVEENNNKSEKTIKEVQADLKKRPILPSGYELLTKPQALYYVKDVFIHKGELLKIVSVSADGQAIYAKGIDKSVSMLYPLMDALEMRKSEVDYSISHFDDELALYNKRFVEQKPTATPNGVQLKAEEITEELLHGTSQTENQSDQDQERNNPSDNNIPKNLKKVKPKNETVDKSNEKADNEDGSDAAPVIKIAGELLTKFIDKGIEFSPAKLYEIADKAFGGTMAQGKYSIKDAYDALELAVNKHIMNNFLKTDDFNSSVEKAKTAVRAFQEMLSKLPTQNKRTVEMEQYQQFSTPPNIAYLAAWVSNINKNDTVLEPSGGIGGLALFAKSWGAEVHLNELSKRRLEIVKNLGFDGYYNLNAEQIDNLLPESIKPSVVIMNPPFSSAATRMGDKNSTANAKRHIEQALARLEPNGRLVAILGQGMEYYSSFKPWWDSLSEKYNVRANIRISGDNYKKYGTSFGIQLVVIDKTGKTTKPIETGVYEDLLQIPKVLESIRNERVNYGKPNTTITSGEAPVKEPGPNRSVSDAGNRGNQLGENKHPNGAEKRPSGSNRPKSRNNDTGETIQVSDNSSRGKAGTGQGQNGNVRGDSERGSVAPISISNAQQSYGELRTEPIAEDIQSEDDVYSNYTPKKLAIKGAKPHLTTLVESAAMAAIDPPDIAYAPHLPNSIITKGDLTIAQLETVVYAGQAHSKTLPNGQTKGFFIGDGTGVGKGREIAGIILDNFNQGRTKAVWISTGQKLFESAKRDWTGLGGNEKDLFNLSDVKVSNGIMLDKGIMYASFGTLQGASKADNKRNRITQILEWLGEDFDGVIVFDEAHKMANAGKNSEAKRGKSKATATALRGIELQNLLPKARVVYSSATGATEVGNLAYASRLGLWGEGTSFADVDTFISKIASGGLAAMELVARDMKALGVYIARNLSYKGVEYDTLTHDITPVQEEIYNTMATAWQTVLQNLNKVLSDTNADKNSNAKKNAKAAFYGAMQRFFNQVITSMSMPSVIKDIQRELDAGHSAVIQIVNTNQAATDRKLSDMDENDSLEDLDLTPSEGLIDFLRNSFPVYEYEETVDDNGNTVSVLATDGDGNPIVSREAVKIRDGLIADIKEMKVPDGPLEMLFDAFGVEMVAEVTGRTRRIISKKQANGETKRAVESRGKSHSLADIKAFQDGKKRILIFSNAGGTGESYHADKNAKNQQKRIHYLLQPGWSAFNATQGFGRSHRTGQVLPPLFRLVTTNITGQKRFVTTIAKRLDSLGALTKGHRGTGGGGIFGQKDNLESEIARDALATFYGWLGRHNSITGIAGKEIFTKMGLYEKFYDKFGIFKPSNEDILRDIPTFLNRILSLEVNIQNATFEQFNYFFERHFSHAVELGQVDVGLENYIASKIDVKDEVVIQTDEQSGAETKYVQLTAYKKTKLIPYGDLTNFKPNFVGLVKDDNGSVKAVYRVANKTLANGDITEAYELLSPVVGVKSNYIQKTLDEKTKTIPKTDWLREWEKETDNAPEYTENTVHMLTGTLLPIWDKLPTSNTRVMRVVSSDGRQYLGRIIPPNEIDITLSKFKTERTKEIYTPSSLFRSVMVKGLEIKLERDRTKLSRKRVSGEYRLEISGDNSWQYQRQIPGIITETIQYERRYFIPTDEATALPIIERLTNYNPVVSVESKQTVSEVDALTTSTDYLTSTSNSPAKLGVATGDNLTGKAKKASEIVKQFETKIMDATGENYIIRNGKKTTQGSIGEFNRREYSVRLRKANDIPTLSHEVGHMFDTLYELSTGRSSEINAELTQLGENTSKPNYNPPRKRREGVAEFVRLYLTDYENAVATSPLFASFFERRLPSSVLIVLNELKSDIWSLTNLDPVSRVKSSISFKSDKKQIKISEKLNPIELFKTLYFGVVDATYPVEDAAGELGGSSARQNVVETLSALRGYEGIAMFDINPHGHEGKYQTTLNGDKVGDTLYEILKPIHTDETTRTDFWAYAVARRSEDYFNRGLEMPDTKETYEETVRIMEVKHPEFKDTFAKLLVYEENNLNLLVEGGIYSADKIAEIREANPNHVSLKRIHDTLNSVAGSGRSLGGSKKVIKSLKGGGQDIVDPEESIINNTFINRSVAMRNALLVKLADLADNAKGKGFIMAKAKTQFNVTKFNLEQLKELIQQQMGGLFDNVNLDVMARIFTPNYLAGPNQIVVYRKGQPVLYDVNPFLYNSISSMTNTQQNLFLEALMLAARIQKAGIIFTPKYLAYNLSRDTIHNLVASRNDISPVDIALGFVSALTRDKYYKLAQTEGAYTNFYMANDRPFQQETIDDMLAGTSLAKRFLNALRHPSEVAHGILEPFEMAGKIAEFKKHLKDAGFSRKDIGTAVYQARDLNIDFRRMGYWTKKYQLNRLINFLNSQIQGVDKTIRLFVDPKTRYKATFKSMLYITLPTIFLWWLCRDNDYYKNLPAYRRDFFWNIPLGNPSTTKNFLPIPRPFELGLVFGALPERILRTLFEEDPISFSGFGETVQQALIPEIMPTAFQPLYEDATGKDWRNIPILNAQDKMLGATNPELQFNSYTSETSKAISNIVKGLPVPDLLKSPKRLDHLIKGYTGTMGDVALNSVDQITGAKEGVPVIGGLTRNFVVDGLKSSQIPDNYYSYKETLDSQYKVALVTGKAPQGYNNDVRKYFNQISEELTKIKKAASFLENTPNPEKEQKLNKLRETELKLMKSAIELYNKNR